MSGAPVGNMLLYNGLVQSSDECRNCADWVQANVDIPTYVETTAAAAPLLMSYIAAELGITVSNRHISYSTPSHRLLCVLFSYECFRSSSQYCSGDEIPHLAISIAMDDEVHFKPGRMQSPQRQCNCPFVCYVRIFLQADDAGLATFSEADLTSFQAFVEFPYSAGWHNGTHVPRAGPYPNVCGAYTVPTCSTPGVALDEIFMPWHPRVLQILHFFCHTLSAAQFVRLIQPFLRWLHPLFLRNPDVSVSYPNHIVQQATGIPVYAPLKNSANTFRDDCYADNCRDQQSGSRASEVTKGFAPILLRPAHTEKDAGAVLAAVSMISETPGSANANAGRVHTIRSSASRDATFSGESAEALDNVISAEVFSSSPKLSVSKNSSLAESRSNLGQHPSYTAMRWTTDEADVSHKLQWMQRLRRRGMSALDFFLDVTVPAMIEKKWGQVVM